MDLKWQDAEDIAIRLVEEHPEQLGNTDGVPWPLRYAANRINIANAVLDQQRILDRPVDEKLGPPTQMAVFGREGVSDG